MRSLFLSIAGILAITSSGYTQELKSSKTEEIIYRISQGALIGGLAWDMTTTVKMLGNPIYASYDMQCSPPLLLTCHHVEKKVNFIESGWAGMFGAENPKAVVMANVALGAGLMTVNHLMYKKGRTWRKVGIALNFVQAAINMQAAVGNLKKLENEKKHLVPPNAINVSVRW